MASTHETNTGATRLEWSADDDDDFFSEDGKQNSDGGMDDGFDVDEDLDVSPERKDTDDSNDPIVQNCGHLEDTEMVVADKSESVTDVSLSLTTTPDQTTRELLPHSAVSGVPLPSLVSKVINFNEEIRSMGMVDDSSDPKVLNAPKKFPVVSDSADSGPVPATPLSLAGTMATPLIELEDEDEKFEEIVRQRNRVRKEREDYHIAHIKVQMVRLEDALAAETKRRVDATTALDELARTTVHEMEERVRGQLREENERLQTRLGALEERVRTLEGNWVIDSNNQIELVNSKAADLSKSISQIRDDQNMERKARLKREGILLQQVEGHAKEAENRWSSEHNDRVQRLAELEDQIIRNEARLALEQKRYEDRIETELTSLKGELEIEAAERQTQDEEIVAALNRYTQQLQHSLSILSSD